MSLSDDKRQKTGKDSWTRRSGEAGKGGARETESLLAAHEHESPATIYLH